jgi:hypothetical protein
MGQLGKALIKRVPESRAEFISAAQAPGQFGPFGVSFKGKLIAAGCGKSGSGPSGWR